MDGNINAQFPRWLPVVVNIIIALLLVGTYLVLYILGNIYAWRGTVEANWPTKDPLLQSVLTAVGGIMAAVFAVALNLPHSPLPKTLGGVSIRAMQLLTLFVSRQPHLGIGIDWTKINAVALRVFGVVLTLSFLVLTGISAVTKALYSAHAPQFILDFAASGVGVIVGSFLAWTAQITQRSEQNPSPQIDAIAPQTILHGAASISLAVTGRDFVPASIVRCNEQNRNTTFINGNQLNATIPNTDLANPQDIQVTVFNPAPGGGVSPPIVLQVT